MHKYAGIYLHILIWYILYIMRYGHYSRKKANSGGGGGGVEDMEFPVVN